MAQSILSSLRSELTMMPSRQPIATDAFMDLVKVKQVPCISIYLPTATTGRSTMEGRIILKKQLKRTEATLKEMGCRWDEIANLLIRSIALTENPDFWEHQSEGLAIFISDDIYYMYKLPITVPEMDVVGETFHVTPLLQLLNRDDHFYVLTLSENEVRLFEATEFSMAEVTVEGLPASMAEAMWPDDQERQQQWHGSNSQISGDQAVFTSGSGNQSKMQRNKTDYRKYFSIVNTALSSTFKRLPAPLVLAGVSYLLPIYRSENTCAKILAGEVQGNQERTDQVDLHKAAWAIAKLSLNHTDQDTKDAFEYALSKGTASYTPTEISKAAKAGRVSKLFVSTDFESLFGNDPEISKVNQAAISTLIKGGEVYALAPQDMPLELNMAAMFRY